MTDATIIKTVFFGATRETVWAYLTEKDKLGQWFHPADKDLEKGQDFSLIATADDGTETIPCWGTVLEMERPSLLSYTFTIKPLNGAMTTVSWQLEDAHGGTMLTLRHAGIDEAAGEAALGLLMALDAGWDKHLARLRPVFA